MTAKNVVRVLGAALVVAGAMGGCRCSGQAGVDEAKIDEPPLDKVYPNVDRPRAEFPRSCQTDDPTLNKFIGTILAVCERGDYDTFRQSFGTAYDPTEEKDFERFWRNVGEIRVAGIYPGKADPPEYYVHVVVRLREADRKGRQSRDAVVTVFQELGEWRIVPASKEIIQKVLAASTQPASVPADSGQGGEAR